MPTDPALWDSSHVNHWVRWAAATFNNAAINPADWNMDGVVLCKITHEQFKRKVSDDPSDLFWTHLELLRKCKFVAVVQNANGVSSTGGVTTNVSKGAQKYSIGPRSQHQLQPANTSN